MIPSTKCPLFPGAGHWVLPCFYLSLTRLSYSKKFLESQLCSLFGGRIAEELIFGHDSVTTGASNDIQRATSIARSMVTKWGLSEKLGPLTYDEEEGEVFLGHSVTKHKEISNETARLIDSEIKDIIDRNYNTAEDILKSHIDKLHIMADALMKYETLDSHQIDDIMEGRTPRPPSDWGDDDHESGSLKKKPWKKGQEKSFKQGEIL